MASILSRPRCVNEAGLIHEGRGNPNDIEHVHLVIENGQEQIIHWLLELVTNMITCHHADAAFFGGQAP